MGNELFLTFTTDQLPPTQQNLAKYKLRIVEPPAALSLEKISEHNGEERRGSALKPNLWMWVSPNIVFPPGKLEAPEPAKGEQLTSPLSSPQGSLKGEDLESSSEVTVDSPSTPSSEKFPPPKHFASSPSIPQLLEEEVVEVQDDSSSVALMSPDQRALLQNERHQHTCSKEGQVWARPPLNYFQLIALALRNSAPCGLNVQQIYSFTRQHFPFFLTAPESWKNNIRHNLCFRDCFEKVPMGTNSRGSYCLWKLTEKGHHRFLEEIRTLATSQVQSIQKCMSQPDMMPFLFDVFDSRQWSPHASH
ncbi:forkhead box protein R1 [Suncus etruscus]|uniref:forkhead box protein R1 n=1 Tax=Suncus etruscus TaxID=109475 RepID=UPI0021104D02|nr:forkhead box protein R1 [Suncus etruscus]